MADGYFENLPIPFKIIYDPEGKVDSSITINGLDLTQDRVLKSAQFSEAITGELMLAGLTYTVTATWS